MILTVLKTFSRILNLLPRQLVLRMGDWLGDIWFYGLRFRKTLAIENVRHALQVDENVARDIARANFRHCGKNLIECLQGICWNKQDYLSRADFLGFENVEPYFRDGKGGIFLTSHLGNWEFAIAAAAANAFPIDVVVKRSKSTRFDSFLWWYRQRTGARILPESGTAKDILSSIARGRWVCFILDQFMGPPIGLPVRFFNRMAGTAVGLALLTERREIPIVPVYSFRDQSGQHKIILQSPLSLAELSSRKDDRLYEKTQAYNDVLESHIRQHPEQWLWIHRRWKTYRGVPRWKPAVALSALLLALAGCAGTATKEAAKTGIPLPPDPQIELPQFRQKPAQNATGAEEEEVRVTLVEPTPSQEAVTPPAKRGKKSALGKTKGQTAQSSLPTQPLIVEVAGADKMPFQIGERIELELGWMGLPAGRAVLEVREGPNFGTRQTYHFWGHVLSSKLVDAIYHVDNTIETFSDREALIPYKFLLHMVETAQLKETRVSFDHAQGKAHYWARRISSRWGNQNIDRQDKIQPLVRDMHSVLYSARSKKYALNQKETLLIYENGEIIELGLLPVANEVVRTKAGVFQAWKILITLKLNNALKPTGEVYLWLSDDSKRYPVKFDAKLKIGSLYGTLVSVRES